MEVRAVTKYVRISPQKATDFSRTIQGKPVAEALAMDKPVVAKAFGGALDVVRSGIDGLLVAADGSKPYEDDFSQAIEEVSKMKFSSLREDALERFDFEKMLERSISVYKELAGNGE